MRKGDYVFLKWTPKPDSLCAVGRVGQVLENGDAQGLALVRFDWMEPFGTGEVPRRMEVFCDDGMVFVCGVPN